MSTDMAEILAQKIREMEGATQQESEKGQKSQKAKAQKAAKAKLKEAKLISSNADLTDAEKVKQLWERLEAESSTATELAQLSHKRRDEIILAEKVKDRSQSELTANLGVKAKLESLCTKLQDETKALVDERRKLSEEERLRRQALADEFQNTIADVKKKMDQQASERARLARENEDLRARFKLFFEQYDKREKEVVEQQRAREPEAREFELRLAEQAQAYRHESTREAAAMHENEELVGTEKVLREQLQTYTSKFNQFQDGLSKSDKVLGQYKRQRTKMQRRVEGLEKENSELRNKNERRLQGVVKERDLMLKEKEAQQEKCKKLQVLRQELKEQAAKSGS